MFQNVIKTSISRWKICILPKREKAISRYIIICSTSVVEDVVYKVDVALALQEIILSECSPWSSIHYDPVEFFFIIQMKSSSS